jgi:zinc transport system permease protein
MAIGSVLGMAFTCGGLALSYAPDLPAGATIILLAGTTYLLSLGANRLLPWHKTRRART